MNKFQIIVPGTSANLGEGFDCLGIAVKRYNIYEIELCDKFELIGFDDHYIEDNLILLSYKKVFEYLHLHTNDYKIKITQVKQDIPVSRGLGSSSACIVTGVIAANYILGNILTIGEVVNLCTMIEGHPDNVLPCLFGGLTSGFVDNKEVYYHRYEVSNQLYFSLLIPNFELKTEIARKALPEMIKFKDAITHLSKCCSIPESLRIGDFKQLTKALNEPLHEIYRLPLIKDGLEIKQQLTDEHHLVIVSGAGPTLICISDIDDDIKLDNNDWIVVKVGIDNEGVKVHGI